MPSIATKPALDRARALGAKLETRRKANDAIKLTLKILRNTIGRVGDFSWRDKTTGAGVPQAWEKRIKSQLDRVGVLQKRLRKLDDAGYFRKADRKPPEALRNQIGLAVIQAAQLLKDLKAAVAESNRDVVQRIMNEFAKAMADVLEAVGKALLAGTPWYVLAGVAYLLMKKK